jgi:D-arabinose 1-dehydrogenase-like Zn-dependent alcohol dehydrogenase
MGSSTVKQKLADVCALGSNSVCRLGRLICRIDAEYCKLRCEAAVHIHSHVDAAKYAPILCAGLTVFNAIRKMNIPPGATVGIQGIGGLGHLAIQYAHKLGYRVVALSRDSSKEKVARELGADEYVDASKVDTAEALQKLGGASLIVAMAPSADAISPLLKGLGIMGKLLILSGESLVRTWCSRKQC